MVATKKMAVSTHARAHSDLQHGELLEVVGREHKLLDGDDLPRRLVQAEVDAAVGAAADQVALTWRHGVRTA
jgi:hypothetical protein